MQSIYYLNGEKLKEALFAGFANLTKHKQEINQLNVFPVPDGDTGTNMHLTVSSAIKEVEDIAATDVTTMINAMSRGALMGARGNSGVILSQLFRGFAQELEHKEEMNYKDFVLASENAVRMAYKAVLKPVEGTILTVAKAVAQGIKEASYSSKDLLVLLMAGLELGEQVLQRTPEMLPVLAKANVVDAGGKGLLVMLQGIVNHYLGEVGDKIIYPPLIDGLKFSKEIEEQAGEYAYCTECIIKGANLIESVVRDEIINLGDSVLVVGNDDIIKVHIHTSHPGTVLEKCLEYGKLHDIKIDNMQEQHNNFLELESVCQNSVVSIVAGEGLKEIMQSMGVDTFIEGGQTMNPSTEDILSALEKTGSNDVILLPNNTNIILAAEQAIEFTKKNVKLIPTKTFPQGMAAMLGYDPGETVDNNYDSMLKHYDAVQTGEITYAVRDTNYNDLDIKKGDILAILDGEIVFVGKEVHQVTINLLELVAKDDKIELVTIFYGEGVTEKEALALKDQFSVSFPELEIELYWGGQPLYHYIISVE